MAKKRGSEYRNVEKLNKLTRKMPRIRKKEVLSGALTFLLTKIKPINRRNIKKK
ncbi:hypothetical protein [Flagellimonas sp. 2504JD1-5]